MENLESTVTLEGLNQLTLGAMGIWGLLGRFCQYL